MKKLFISCFFLSGLLTTTISAQENYNQNTSRSQSAIQHNNQSYYLDEQGNPYYIDQNGQPFYLDQNGQPYYLDKEGYGYYLDENGQPYYIDQDGHPYYLDQDGQPIYLKNQENRLPVDQNYTSNYPKRNYNYNTPPKPNYTRIERESYRENEDYTQVATSTEYLDKFRVSVGGGYTRRL